MPFFLFAYLCIIAAEENYLEGKFGQEFIEYCNRVNRIIPNFSGFRNTLKSTVFKWKRLISADYGTIFYWVAGIICIYGKNVWLHKGYDNVHQIFPVLGALLLFSIIAYGTARYLKKSKRLAIR